MRIIRMANPLNYYWHILGWAIKAFLNIFIYIHFERKKIVHFCPFFYSLFWFWYLALTDCHNFGDESFWIFFESSIKWRWWFLTTVMTMMNVVMIFLERDGKVGILLCCIIAKHIKIKEKWRRNTSFCRVRLWLVSPATKTGKWQPDTNIFFFEKSFQPDTNIIFTLS